MAIDHSRYDINNKPSLIAVSNGDGTTPVSLWADPSTHALVVAATATLSKDPIPASGLTQAVAVQIVDGSGNQVASFGGGTQYAELTTTAPGTGTLSLGRYKLSAPTLTDGQLYGLQLDSSGNLKVTGSLSVGGTTDNAAYTAGSSTGTPSFGFFHSVIDTVTDGHTAALAIDSKRNLFNVIRDAAGNARGANVNASNQLSVSVDNSPVLGAGSAVIGHVITDTGSTTAVTGTVTVSGTVTANAGTNLNTSLLALESGGNLATLAGGVSSSVYQSNTKQINGVTVLMGNGVTGTGSQRVTIASDNTAFTVNAAQSGTWNIGTLTSITNALPAGTNVIGHVIADSGSTTAVTGSVTVVQGTGTNLHTVLDSGVLTSITNALPVGANVIGKVSIDQTTPGTTNAVAVTSEVTPADRTGSGSIAGLNQTVVATTNGCSIVSFNIAGTWSATLLIESTIDGGSSWISIDGDVDATDTIINNTTTNGLVTVNCASYGQVRLRANPYTSGTATVTWSANSGLSLVEVFNTNGNSLRVQDLASGTTGATAPTAAQAQGNVAQTSLPTAVTAGQLTNNMADKFGRQVMLNNAIRDIMGSQTTTITSSTAETTIITAASSIFNDLTAVFISNTSATAARIDIRDTTAGTVIFQIFIPAGDMRGVSLTTPWPQTSVNTNWTAQSSASVADLRVSALFVRNK